MTTHPSPGNSHKDNPAKGRLIVLEGLDGVGKSTLAASLTAALGAAAESTPGVALRSARAAFEAELSACRTARSLAYGATVVAAGARAAQLQAGGTDVVMDRYWLSTRVHAPAAAQGALAAMEPHITPPACTLYLRLPLDARRARLAQRGLSDEDQRTLDAHVEVEAAYLALRGHPAAGRFVEIDASKAPAEVLADCLAALEG